MTEKANEKRLFSVKELCNYTGLGRSKATSWGEEIGALVRIGRRTLYDREVIDEVLRGGRGNGNGN